MGIVNRYGIFDAYDLSATPKAYCRSTEARWNFSPDVRIYKNCFVGFYAAALAMFHTISGDTFKSISDTMLFVRVTPPQITLLRFV